MPPAKTHRCPGPRCTEQVPQRVLMCVRHWRQVPEPLQRAVWRTFRQRHRGGQYEGDHYNAVRAAIASVRDDASPATGGTTAPPE